MEREKVIKLMRTVCIPVGKSECIWWEMADGVPTQISRLIELVEQETLERAAKLCDVQKEKNIDYANEYDEKELESLGFWSRVSALDGVSRLIRNLKDNHEKE